MSRCTAVCLLVALALAACSGSAQLRTPAPSAAPGQAVSGAEEATTTATVEPGPSATTPAPPATAIATSQAPATEGSPAAQPAAPQPLRFVYVKDGKLWLWREETGQAAEIPVQGEPVAVCASSDGKLIAYRVRLSDTESEIRVVGTNGQGDHKLATTNTAEVPQRYPGTEQYYVPTFDWVPDTHLVYYGYQLTCCGEGYSTLEATHFVDADSGDLRFTLAGGEVDLIRYAPGGRQLAALTATELRLIDTGDGQVLYRFPVENTSMRGLNMSYSPGGRWLVAVTKPGFTVVDTQSGARRDIPFTYQPYGMGNWLLFPPINWLGDGPIFYSTFSTDSVDTLWSEQSHCTVWRIDAEEGTVASVYEFTGGVWLAQLSPDRTRLLYRRIRAPRVLDLYLADLTTGQEVLYDTGEGINVASYGWAPDSLHFAYRYSEAGDVRLGSVSADPAPLQPASRGTTFLDADRYLTVEQVGDAQRHEVVSLSGAVKAIVDLTGPAPQTEPPYDLGGPVYAYYLGG